MARQALVEAPAAPAAPRREDAPGHNGRPQPAAPPPTRPAEPRALHRLIIRLALGVLAVVAIGAGIAVGYRWWYDSVHFVSTDNAQIAGPMIQVGGLDAGRVANVRYDVGDRVQKDAVVATLSVPVPTSSMANGAPRMSFTETTDSLVDVRSSVSGVVVARTGNPGDTVPAGQPLLMVVDPNQLWVNANVEETQVRRIQPGQRVLIHLDNLDADVTGRVAAITQASAASFSLLPQQNLAGNYTKVTQLQPVKILLDQPDPRLAVGTSVEVKIRVVD